MYKRLLIAFLFALCIDIAGAVPSYAQNKIIAVLEDSSNGDPIQFATVSLYKSGSEKAIKYLLSNELGGFTFEDVKAGKYTLKAEMMGYKPVVRDIDLTATVKLGRLKMDPDSQMLEAAGISEVGNSIIMKKDTVEYNANAFKTMENDVLEDLLKKLPGVEIEDDGSITVNGETIKKITIDGKTFFLNDPQLASKNIPAKMIERLKVIRKKSEQAEFTGIDDGEEEQVIDLSLKNGMKQGLFGNVSVGGGHDVPSVSNNAGDWRFQGAGFVGRFSKNSQLSLIVNANNTNNRGFEDMSGSMMRGMRGSGGRMGGRGGEGPSSTGITTSYMGGLNGAWSLLEDRMNIGGNYLYNHTDNSVLENSLQQTYMRGMKDSPDYDKINLSNGSDRTVSQGHRVGMRLEHKFSENTSIIFEPQVNFGLGNYTRMSDESTAFDYLNGLDPVLKNSSHTGNSGNNRNLSTSGYALLRQRLGLPGRTLTLMARYNVSNNQMHGVNMSNTWYSDKADSVKINQRFDNIQESYSVMGRLTYTEPLGNKFYIEGNYSYQWAKSTSGKSTYDFDETTGKYKTDINPEFSNSSYNESHTQTIGANLLYQEGKSRAQIGFSAIPVKTYNKTDHYVYNPGVMWNWSPQAMLRWDFTDFVNLRLRYRGETSQPSVSKMMTVPDVSNPLNVTFGNAYLKPYFSHNLNIDTRYNNRKAFSSCNFRISGGLVQDPIVNAMWYGTNGAQYSMPFNGPVSANAGLNGFFNVPIAHSDFSVSNTTNLRWNLSSYYSANVNIDMSTYEKEGYYAFMDEFLAKYGDIAHSSDFSSNVTNTVNFMDRLMVKYNNDKIEVQLGGSTRMNKSWYRIGNENTTSTTTWSNKIRATLGWSWNLTGINVKTDADYNWYNGYAGDGYKPEFIWNLEIQKLVWKKKITISLKGFDLLGQAKNLSVMDDSNSHREMYNNTLGRYIILSVAYRFGSFDKSKGGGRGSAYGGMGARFNR